MSSVVVIGGGLAGSEAAWQAARFGVPVTLYEMRPDVQTEAHRTGLLGELVCSNSLRSDLPDTAHGLLKQELTMFGSLIMEAARHTSVPAGSALAVDRALFAKYITKAIESNPQIEVIRQECSELSRLSPIGFDGSPIVYVLATGPLTSQSMSNSLAQILGHDSLFFYDAIAPVIDAETIDYSKVFSASRYGKGGDDYINCPMDKECYLTFYDALVSADKVNVRDFEDNKVFEGCMPIEVMASRGVDTPRFGPMKPVGLIDPETGKTPYAVVQLRTENSEKSAYNMVGFQTRLKYPEQQRIFRMIPGLKNAEFLRFGSVHRNTYINSPACLTTELAIRGHEHILVAGQITGVEGYLESTAMGLFAGITAARKVKGFSFATPSETTSIGALIKYVTSEKTHGAFQPSNINFSLFPPPEVKTKDKSVRRQLIVKRALAEIDGFIKTAYR
ncbi:MAG: methylenetetrahydrofolate--tRNA-(uracil(54)-C(5))-methyltransferase (FADH(2)-oxidizing) TrmFO [Nitrospirae bacterium]|nr:methylenetetrahydrofolate--tRNA-(uracil(54)-C(5))-methyltransferase (FADH(2)-oxidizing) TrmFO [Nitrospirota bacterium]MBF0536554.1 methylenetetrahydrofolate--tRNA-(uracil(54)-C(5))-methyltransferase (FADH(2)-oxidizing) TrmFO [Nitrospirota bacterium]MBF0618473.1 methylenetetrahydrofolate--tRNA-(uracil(54)-C(5))-methyltransferase (FADH(2)-oxidizing) TrmFO [Nitrospirota bacterium]